MSPFDDVRKTNNSQLWIQTQLAYCAKGARNIGSHNGFVSTISNESSLFIMMIVLSAVVSQSCRDNLFTWYQEATAIICGDAQNVSRTGQVDNTIKRLADFLESNGHIDHKIANDYYSYESYKARDFLYFFEHNGQIKDNINISV